MSKNLVICRAICKNSFLSRMNLPFDELPLRKLFLHPKSNSCGYFGTYLAASHLMPPPLHSQPMIDFSISNYLTIDHLFRRTSPHWRKSRTTVKKISVSPRRPSATFSKKFCGTTPGVMKNVYLQWLFCLYAKKWTFTNQKKRERLHKEPKFFVGLRKYR